MIQWFEKLIDPFVPVPVEQPPARLLAFYRYFIAPVLGVLVIVMIISLVTNVIAQLIVARFERSRRAY